MLISFLIQLKYTETSAAASSNEHFVKIKSLIEKSISDSY